MTSELLPYLQSLLDNKLPFLALKKAAEKEVTVISQNDDIWYKTVPDNMSYALFSEFENTDNQVYIVNDVELKFRWDIARSTSLKLIPNIPNAGKKEYFALFEKAMEQLENGALKKVVLSRKQVFVKNDSDLNIFERLLNTYPTANSYFFYHPKVGKWMAATPEILLEVKVDKLSTMSLAGTAINDGSDTHVWGAKEIEEQQLVTDFILSQFEKVGITHIKQSNLETLPAGHLVHLCTLLSGKVESYQIQKILEALHPTPAVCGLPRDGAMNFILNNENYDRSYYTGYLGVINNDNRNYYVNLRCMELLENTVEIYVGGGITSKSNAVLEYQETTAKLQTMLRLL